MQHVLVQSGEALLRSLSDRMGTCEKPLASWLL